MKLLLKKSLQKKNEIFVTDKQSTELHDHIHIIIM
jgi:hypothetical protein